MLRSILLSGAAFLGLGLVAAIAAPGHDEVAMPVVTDAVAVLVPTKSSDGQVAGTIVFKAEKGYVHVTGEVTGLSLGDHGFHIHMFGDLRADDGTSAGGHYNPEGHDHGGLDSHDRHAGDLGNIEASKAGVAKVNIKVMGLNLQNVLGRSVVVHADADDLTSQPAGNAGPRIAVGVIGLADGAPKK